MNYEKKYKQLYTLINDLYPYVSEYCKEKVEGFFPELAESEDERIRKWCISHFKAAFRVTKNNAEYQEYLNKKVIPWLEKLGESFTKKDVDDAYLKGVCDATREIEKIDTPKDYRSIDPYFLKPIDIDTINPRFKVDDWITDGEYTWKVIDVRQLDYILQSQDGKVVDDTISYVDEHFHLWTIKDARDGNVLVYQNGDTEIIMIFKSERDTFHAYTHFQVFNNTYEVNNSCVWCIGGHPATKGQRAFLFQKMKEAGYEWDADKKELKKIENL